MCDGVDGVGRGGLWGGCVVGCSLGWAGGWAKGVGWWAGGRAIWANGRVAIFSSTRVEVSNKDFYEDDEAAEERSCD